MEPGGKCFSYRQRLHREGILVVCLLHERNTERLEMKRYGDIA